MSNISNLTISGKTINVDIMETITKYEYYNTGQ